MYNAGSIIWVRQGVESMIASKHKALMQHQAMPERRNGPCKFRWNAARKEALDLALWHHIHKIVIEEAFGITMGLTTWPDILFFKRFKTFLPNIAISNVKSGVEVCSQLLPLSWIFSWCHWLCIWPTRADTSMWRLSRTIGTDTDVLWKSATMRIIS